MNQYISEVVFLSLKSGLITLEDLYTRKESDLVEIFHKNFRTWEIFSNSTSVSSSDYPTEDFSVCVDVKRRNVIPLVEIDGKVYRLDEVSESAKEIYEDIEEFSDKKYGYIKNLKRIE